MQSPYERKAEMSYESFIREARRPYTRKECVRLAYRAARHFCPQETAIACLEWARANFSLFQKR